MIDETTQEYADYLIKTAEANVTTGIINEPRVYYDTITLGSQYIEVEGHPLVFQNGEDFPVRITHMTFSMARLRLPSTAVDPNNIQAVGFRMKFHDQYYMNAYSYNPFTNTQRQLFTPVPAWALMPTAAASIISDGTAAWKFQRPFVLSARDSMRVDVQLDAYESGEFPATVTFTGSGAVSRRPYLKPGTIYINSAQRLSISTENYQNDGDEPVIVTDVTVTLGANVSSGDPTGDLSRLSVGIRQIGNGTNSAWVNGPTNDAPLVADMVPAVNLGQLSGRCVVHRFPGKGLLWQPGDGVTVQAQNLNTTSGNRLQVAMLGYIAIP